MKQDKKQDKKQEKKQEKKQKRRSLKYRIDRIIISVALIMMVVAVVVSANLYVSHYTTESQLLLSYMADGLEETIDPNLVEGIKNQVLKGYREACENYEHFGI